MSAPTKSIPDSHAGVQDSAESRAYIPILNMNGPIDAPIRAKLGSNAPGASFAGVGVSTQGADMPSTMEKAKGLGCDPQALRALNLQDPSADLGSVKTQAPGNDNGTAPNPRDPDAITVLYDAEARDVGAKHVTRAADGGCHVGPREKPTVDADGHELVIHETLIARDWATYRANRQALASMPHAYIVRGATRKPSTEPQCRLAASKHGDARTLEDVPRRWLHTDHDDLTTAKHGIPANIVADFREHPERAAIYVRDDLMPECFRGARCRWQASGSSGFEPGKVSLRLSFRMRDPITGAETELLLADQIKERVCDGSIYRPAQPLYTAAPILGEGVVDPMSAREGELEGADEVIVPPHAFKKASSNGLANKSESGATQFSLRGARARTPWRKRVATLETAVRKRDALNAIAFQAGLDPMASIDELWGLAEPALARNPTPVEDWALAQEIAHDGFVDGQAERERNATEHAAAKATRIASSIQEIGLTAPYTAADVERWATDAGVSVEHFQKRWIVQYEHAYFFFFAGTYVGPYSAAAFDANAAKWLAPAHDYVQLRWPAKSGGEGVRKSRSDLMEQYGIAADRVIESLSSQTSHYDPTEHTLMRALHVPRELPPLTPVDLEFVQGIIKRMWPDPELRAYVLDWLATAMDLSQPAPALQLRGLKGQGKDAFAAAVGRLWRATRTPFTDLNRLLGEFGDGIDTSPLAYANEELHKARGSMSAKLRALILGQGTTINRKGKPVTQVQGSIRVIIGAQAAHAASTIGENANEDLSRADIEAIGDRFIDAPIAESCPPMTKPEAQRLIYDDVLARYCHWLSDPANHTVQPTARGACRATSDVVASALATATGLGEAIIRHVVMATLGETPANVHTKTLIAQSGNGVAWRKTLDGGAIYICTDLIARQYEAYGAFQKPPIATKLRTAAGQLWDARDMWRPGSGGRPNGTRPRFYRLRRERLDEWLARSDYERADFDAALAAKAVED